MHTVAAVLDTALGDGLAVVRYVQHWLQQATRAPVLHYVALTPNTVEVRHPEFVELCGGDPATWGPGFHRILLHHGQVALTVGVGALADLLAQQTMQVQAVWLRSNACVWDKWSVKAVAKCCAMDAQTYIEEPSNVDPSWLREAGFVPAPPSACCNYVYRPPWRAAPPRGNLDAGPSGTPRCAVIGSGLAGAAVAQALSQRGWQVTVLEQADQVAAGASGLPLGLVVPHVSADDAPRSRLTRSGTRMMLHHARWLLQSGVDWCPSGVMERRLSEGRDIWHAQAAWIKPAHLVQAWLQRPGIMVQTNAQVTRLLRQDQQWAVMDARGHCLVLADHVVLANATNASSLVLDSFASQDLVADLPGKLAALHAMHGTLSHGRCDDLPWADSELAEPPHPYNGKGSFASHIPTPNGLQWYAGSTFEFSAEKLTQPAQQHDANFQRLQRLLPRVATLLEPQFQVAMAGATHGAQAWASTRCATHDRLPLEGPVTQGANTGVWMCVGMGSRGLSFSALCAELLAAYMAGEPLPVEASLARCLHTARRYRRGAATAPVA